MLKKVMILELQMLPIVSSCNRWRGGGCTNVAMTVYFHAGIEGDRAVFLATVAEQSEDAIGAGVRARRQGHPTFC